MEPYFFPTLPGDVNSGTTRRTEQRSPDLKIGGGTLRAGLGAPRSQQIRRKFVGSGP